MHDPAPPSRPAAPPPDAVPPAPPSPPSLTAVAGAGATWMLLNVGATKILAIAAQFVLLGVLSKAEFGVYGVALAISMFIQTFRDGGVRELLVQQAHRYRELVGPTFWFALAVNLGVAALLGLAGEGVTRVILLANPRFFEETGPRVLPNVVWIMAASIPLGTLSAVLQARLRIDLRFAAISGLTTLSALFRYSGQIGLALAGFGIYSLVIPMVAVVLVESVHAFLLTRERPWAGPPRPQLWRGIVRTSLWVTLGSLATGVANNGYNLATGLFMTSAAVGVYVTAQQFHMQVEMVIGFTLMQVMFPILARLNADSARQGEAALRVAGVLALFSAPACLGLAVLFPALELILFAGKWAESAAPLAVLALFYPIRAVFVGVPSPLLQAQGRFKDFCLLWSFNGLGLLAAAAAGAAAFGTPTAVAWCIGIVLGALCLASTARVLAQAGIAPARTIAAVLQPLLLALAVALAVHAADRFALSPALARSSLAPPPAPTPDWPTTNAPPPPPQDIRWDQVVRLGVLGPAYALLFVLAARLFAAARLRDTLRALPPRLAAPAGRLLLLPPPASG